VPPVLTCALSLLAVAVEAGANVLVAGSAIFGAPDRGQAITDIRTAAARATSNAATVVA
jgi:pentose-5-phosphate-3-epimerase